MSRDATQSQFRLIDTPFFMILKLSVESEQVVGGCTLEEEGLIEGEGKSIIGPPRGLSVDGGAIKLQDLALLLAQVNLHSIFPSL